MKNNLKYIQISHLPIIMQQPVQSAYAYSQGVIL